MIILVLIDIRIILITALPCTARVEIYKYNTPYFHNIFKIKKSNVMVNANTPDDGNIVPKHVVEK
jgi:hypothetical protein